MGGEGLVDVPGGQGAGGIRVEHADARGPAAGRGEVRRSAAGEVGGGPGQVYAGGQTDKVADHVAADPGIDLDQPRPTVHQAQLDVLHTVGDPQGLDRSSGGRGDLGQERVGGIDGVPGLVEVRRGAQVLAGHGDRRGRSAVGDAFDREFRPVEVLLDQDAGVLATAARSGRGERERGGQFFGPVDADHADAAREGRGLDDRRQAEGHRRQAGLQ